MGNSLIFYYDVIVLVKHLLNTLFNSALGNIDNFWRTFESHFLMLILHDFPVVFVVLANKNGHFNQKISHCLCKWLSNKIQKIHSYVFSYQNNRV